MRIAQVAPLYESVPPKTYGGTERVVSYLTEELVRQGHEVTLFASGDSVTNASLISTVDCSLRLHPNKPDPAPLHAVQLGQVQIRRDDFDIIHYHNDYLHFPMSRANRHAQLTTLHGRLDLPELIPLYEEFSEMPLISISQSQRTPLNGVNWVSTIHHGLPEGLFNPVYTPGKYLAFLGRISPEKRVDRAIEIARRAGLPLKIAAKVDKADEVYYQEKIAPLLKASPFAEYIGEINEEQKQDFLGGAIGLLFPIDWPEPFGLVMIEAMACGTPVIAYRRGSVPEVIEPGVNGFCVSNIDEAVEAVGSIDTISRQNCRQEFLRRFTAYRMARNYVEAYGRVRSESRESRESSHGRSAFESARPSGRGYYPNPQPILRAGELVAQYAAAAGFKTVR